ncbi:MAG: SRPBCC domain-containing protein [Polyangiaceae bacterium]
MTPSALPSTLHETLVFERQFGSPPEAVFAAYADVDLRSRWSAPSPTAAVVYGSADFRIDGEDRFRCGGRHDLQFTGVVRYLDIVEAQRIVYSEVISSSDARLSVSLVTWDLRRDGEGTHLLVTDHVASFVGADMIDGSRAGMNAALDNLVEAMGEVAQR